MSFHASQAPDDEAPDPLLMEYRAAIADEWDATDAWKSCRSPANKVEMERARRRLRSSINALFGEVV